MVSKPLIDFLKCTHKAHCIFSLLCYFIWCYCGKVRSMEECFTFCSESAEVYSRSDIFQKQLSQCGPAAKKPQSPAFTSFLLDIAYEEWSSPVSSLQ